MLGRELLINRGTPRNAEEVSKGGGGGGGRKEEQDGNRFFVPTSR